MPQIDAEDCSAIRRRRRNHGIAYRALAREYGVDNGTIEYHAKGECSHDVPIAPLEQERRVSVDEVVAVLRDADDPVLTTAEVHERVGEPYNTLISLRTYLERAAEDGPIEYKNPGRSYLWWYASEDETAIREVTDADR